MTTNGLHLNLPLELSNEPGPPHLTPASSKQVTVSYSTADGTAKASDNDYTAVSSTTLTFAPDETTKTVSVATTEDTRNEATEAFTVTLSGPRNATLKSDATTATGTIDDDDDLPVLSIADATAVDEGEAVQFEVTLAPASGKQVTVSYSTADDTAKASEDYTAASSTTLTFAAGDTTKTISVATTEDTRNEDQETFTVTLSGPTNATLKSDAKTATGTIDDDDALPVLSIAGATVDEGEPAQFEVTLTPASGKQVTVSYSTDDGTAKASEDYTAASSTTLTFTAGDTTKTVSVATTEDTRNEGPEAFTVALSGPANATLKSDAKTATGTIDDDDPLTAAVTAKAQNVTEGQSAEFEVNITGGTSTADVVVRYSVGGTATSSDDYDDPGGTLTIASGAATGTITIATKADDVVEPSETLQVTLTSASTASRTVTVGGTAATTTILDGGSVTVSVKAVIVEDDENTPVNEYRDKSIADEGESAEFAVELSGAVSNAVQVSYATENGTAESGTGKDYTAKTGTLTFNPNESLTQTITVDTSHDTLNEATETFTMKLTAPNLPAGVALGQATATGRITDGDPLEASVTANDASVDEGETATFTVSLTGGTSTAPVVVRYSVGGSATSGDDYTAPNPTTLTIAAGTSTGTFTIETLTDNVVPETESLEVTLDSAASAGTVTVSTTAATTAIKNTTKPTLILEDEPSSSVRAGRSASGASTRSRSSIACVVCMTEGDTPTGTTKNVRPMLVAGGTREKVIIPDGQTVTIPYQTSDGTAQSGQDYVQKQGTLTFKGDPKDGFKANLQTPITLQTIGDTLNEPDRTFTLTLLSATLPDSTTTDAVPFTVAVRDDDPISAAVEALSSRVSEGQSATFQVSLSGGTPTADVVIRYTVGGSAKPGDDYTAPPGTLTIASDHTSGTITIETLADGVREPNDETMVVTLTGATTAGTATVASGGATTTIAGEDPPAQVPPPAQVQPPGRVPPVTARVSVSAGAPTVNEGDTAPFEVTVSGGSNTEMRISYSVGGTATPGADYTAPSGTLTIGSGASSGTIAIGTLADDVLDPDETLVVQLDGASAGSGVTVTLEATQATTTIVDGTGGASSSGVTVSVAPATATEGDDASFAVELSGKVATPVTVNWSAASGPDDTASEGTDYTATSGTLTFSPMETSRTVQVTTLDDEIKEAAETFTVTLAGPDLPAGVTLGNARATGTIVDDDSLFVTVTAGSATVAEGSPAAFAVTLSGGTSAADVVVEYAVGGTATAGDDYAEPAGTLTIAGGASGASLVIETLADDVLDPGETLEVTLTGATTANGAVSVSATSATTTITDAGAVTVSVAPATVTEGDDASFAVELSGKVAAPVTVSWSAASGPGDTAEAGTDYTAVGGTLIFAPAETSATVQVTTLDDEIKEAAETFTVTLTGPDLPAGVTLGTDRATGTIVDDDSLFVTVTAGSATVAEGNSAAFAVTLSGGTSAADVVVAYAVGGTATAGDDYAEPAGTLTIAGGASGASLAIETLADDVLDPGETLEVLLTGATTANGAVSVSATSATTTITDAGAVTVSVAPATVTEGDDASFAVELSGKVAAPVTVNWSAASGPDDTASEGTDYTAAGGTLTFSPMETSRTVQVTTLDDEIKEAAETFTVTLAGPDLPAGVTLGNARATGTIVDDDSLFVTVTAGSATVAEGSSAVFAVALSGGTSAADVVVAYAVGGTATAGDDYEEPAGTLTIAGGASGASLVIETLADDVLDPGETLEVTLTGATTANGAVSVSSSSATTTITDAGAVTVSVAPATVTEGDDASFAVELSGKVAAPVTVSWSAASGPGDTAEAGTDYTAVGGTLTFVPAETSATVQVTTLDDEIKEAAETFTVTLTGPDLPAGVTLGTDRATGTIVDDDATPPVVEVEVAWGAAAYTATEGGAAAQVTVSLSDDPRRTVVIPLTARNGNGATDADYSGVPDQVTFAGGRTAHTFTVTAISDVDEDAGETVTLGFGELPAAVSAGSPANATITLAGESAQTRHARVIRTLLPEAAVAMTDATVGTIGGRLDDVVRRSGTRGSLALAGVEMLTPLSAHEGSPEPVYWTSRDQVRNISGARLIRGSSFVMTLSDRARMADAASPGENPGSAAVWGSGDYRKLGGSEDALTWRGDMVSLHLGADLVALPNLVAGLALSRSVVGFDYTDRTNPRTVTGTFETDQLGVHPYASWTPSAALGFWATGGLGWGGVGIDDSLDELQTSTTRLLSGALGGSSRVLSVNGVVPGGATALYVKGEGFVTGAWAEESGRIVAQDVGVQQIRLSVEGSHEQRGLWGSVLTPALELGLRHDSGDAAQGAGVELGGELRYVQPELGLTIEGRGRVLATHRSTAEEWGLGGRIQLEFGSDRQGLSLSVAPSLGVVASGTHALWEYGVADGNGLGRPGAGETGASSRLDAQADYRLLTMGGLGVLTPYGGLSLERDGRDYRAGARLETDTFNLSLEGKRSERGTGAADHGVTVQGAVRF